MEIIRVRPTVAQFRPVIASMLLFLLAASSNARGESFEQHVLPILREQCLDCHDASSREGGLDLERFANAADALSDRATWKRVFDVVEAGQMPLPESGYELNDEQTTKLLGFIRHLQAQPDPELGAVDPGKPVLRRLTRLEYNNTVRDLFALDDDIFMFPERIPVADKQYFLQTDGSLGSAIRTSMREYGQKYDVLLPQIGLPGDNRAEYGYANRGDSLNMSPLLLEKYLQLSAVISRSERLLRDSPVMQSLLGVRPPKAPAPTSSGTGDAPRQVAAQGIYAANDNIGKHAEGNDTWKGAFISELTDAFEHGSGGVFDVPASLNNRTIAGKGELIRVQVGNAVLTINPNVDLWLAAFATAEETSGEHLLTHRNKGDKRFELTFGFDGDVEGSIEHLGVCVLARRNQRGTVALTAILSNDQELTRTAEIDTDGGNVFYSFVAPPGTSIQRLRVDGSKFSGDYVLLDDFGFVLNPSIGGTVNRELPVDAPADVDRRPAEIEPPPLVVKPLEQRIETFLTRAYRRTISEPELAAAIRLVNTWTSDREAQPGNADQSIAPQPQSANSATSAATTRETATTEQHALRRLVQTVLSSPEFLFLAEPVRPGEGPVRPLDDFELASRLSYFLWASMPDDSLLEAANRGGLQREEVLRAEVARMLSQRRGSRELSESFATQWLRLDQLYTAKPDTKLFKSFYSGPQGKSTMHAAMMTEALLLFETVLVEDRSVLDLIDPDYTWLNQQLAAHYGLSDVYDAAIAEAQQAGKLPETINPKSAGSYWVRCQLPDRNRGGVMTMAGPLTLTSLPYRTSPIKRGAWLLETIFNRPPAEPKVAFVLDDKPAEESSSTASLSIRQRFEKHRTDPACYSCHSRIDPPGFSLESFDAIGGWRTHDGSQPVDASGVWNGAAFHGPAEFKTALRQREQEFVRGFVEHLLSYAIGRPLESFDMPAVEKIVEQSQADGYRFQSIVEGIVMSYPFRHVRNGG